MDTMTFVTYCLAGFGGLVVVAAIVFVISLFSDKKPDKKDNSDKSAPSGLRTQTVRRPFLF